MLVMTKNAWKACHACEPGFARLNAWNIKEDHQEFSLMSVLNHHSAGETAWALRTCSPFNECRQLTLFFTRWCALRVVHLGRIPEEAMEYLKTGDLRRIRSARKCRDLALLTPEFERTSVFDEPLRGSTHAAFYASIIPNTVEPHSNSAWLASSAVVWALTGNPGDDMTTDTGHPVKQELRNCLRRLLLFGVPSYRTLTARLVKEYGSNLPEL